MVFVANHLVSENRILNIGRLYLLIFFQQILGGRIAPNRASMFMAERL